jgi:hypothetical protein
MEGCCLEVDDDEGCIFVDVLDRIDFDFIVEFATCPDDGIDDGIVV